MNVRNYLAVSLLAVFLAACGGGGGNPGTPSGGRTVNSDPGILGGLVDASGNATSSIGYSGYTVLKVILRDPSGNPIPNQVVSVAGDASQVVFPEGSAGLTNAAGTASIKISRASLTATGAGSLTATYSYKTGAFTVYPDGSKPPEAAKEYSALVGYQLSAANIVLASLNVGAVSLSAYGTRQVSVQALVDGVTASSPVQIGFSANCGQISPAIASTDSSGVATVSYTATDVAGTTPSTLGCSGKTVEIIASTLGAAQVTRSLNVQAAPATNLSFVSVTPSTIFLENSGGITQAIAEFKLVNARGEPLLGQDVSLTLKTQVSGTVKASIGTVGNSGSVSVTTDADGRVSVPIFSGSVPTSVVVNAALVSNPLVQTDSSILTIASGRAAQNRVSLSVKNLSLEGFNADGTSTDVTLSLADRQGNPVPDGTAVNFVTEGGVMIPPVCYTGGIKDLVTGVYSEPGNSRCSVTIRSQAPRPSNGRVSILAYAVGEEDFVDGNFNNIYDAGESFTDMGNAFRDDNQSLTFDTGEFSLPRTGSVSVNNGCPGYLGVPGTCDGVWGYADVRQQATVIFATSSANILGYVTTNTLTVTVSDLNGNSMPTGSKISASGVPVQNGSVHTCSIVSESPLTILNTTGLTTVSFVYVCSLNDLLTVKVTTPLGVVTTKSFTAVGEPIVCTPPQYAQNGVCVNPPAADTAPPIFPVGDPGIDLIGSTSFRLTALINENGVGYYLVQNKTSTPSATCPSVAALLLETSTMAMSANTTANKVIGSLTASTNYQVCFVAKDSAGNPQTTVKTIGPVTTLP